VRHTQPLLLVSCIALFAWLCWVPLSGGATVCVDDFIWVLMAHARPTFAQALVASWAEYMFFRPVDLLANWFVDPRTLGLQPIVPIQMIGLFALTGGVWRLIGIVCPKDELAKYLATLWLWLHPSTQLSIWSGGASSQTWSAAAGVWLICEVTGVQQAALGCLPVIGRLFALSLLGIVFKESFAGWATAASVVVAVRACYPGVRASATTSTIAPWAAAAAIVAIIAPVGAWIAARSAASSFGSLVITHENPHYSFQGPVIIATNTATVLLGMFVQGPVHWARLLPAPWLLLPFLGAGLTAAIALRGARKAQLLADMFLGINPLITCSMIGLIAVWPILVIKHVSELYLMGRNALIAMLCGIGASTIVQPQRVGASFASATALVLLGVIAVIGTASRAYHFGVTWTWASIMRDDAFAAAESSRHICIDERLRQGPQHSKYIVAPATAAVLPSTFQARRLVDPGCANPVFDCVEIQAGDKIIMLSPRLPRRVMW
jgi:hypothetical protein